MSENKCETDSPVNESVIDVSRSGQSTSSIRDSSVSSNEQSVKVNGVNEATGANKPNIGGDKSNANGNGKRRLPKAERKPRPGELYIDSMGLDKAFSKITSFGPIKKLGFFSVHICPDGVTERYHSDKSSLKYFYHNGRESIDLLEGYSSAKRMGRVPPGQVHILKWIIENTEFNENLNANFICHSRALRSIMATPYNKEGWKLIAVKVRGSIVLSEVKPRDRPFYPITEDDEHRNKGSYAGYKFIEKLTRYRDGSQAPSFSTGKRDSFYTVTRSKVGGNSLLYSNRVDCVINEEQLDKPFEEMAFAQIKSRGFNWDENRNMRKRFWQDRVIGWWTDAHCAGIDTIFCGDKTKDCRVEKVTPMSVYNIPQRNHVWSPKMCVEFLEKSLDFIKEMATEELTVYGVTCSSKGSITWRKIDEPVKKHIPSWFINGQSFNDF